MPTEKAVRSDSRHHWGLLCLALYHDKNGTGATTRELYEGASGVFDSPQDVSKVFSRLFNDRSLVEREDTGKPRTKRYFLNNGGWSMLQHVGTPTRTPNGQRVSDEVELPEKPKAMRRSSEHKTLEIQHNEKNDKNEPFGSDKARRRFFAEKDRQEYLEWLENEWKPEHKLESDEPDTEETEMNQRGRYEGTVTTEGAEEMMDSLFGDEDESEPDPDPEPAVAETGDDETETQTVDLSPDWDWLGIQLVKLGYTGLAREAFKANLSPRVVNEDVLDMIHQHANDLGLDLDIESSNSGLTMTESTVDPDEVARFKEALGLDPGQASA